METSAPRGGDVSGAEKAPEEAAAAEQAGAGSDREPSES